MSGGAPAPAPVGGRRRARRGAPPLVRAREDRAGGHDAVGGHRRGHGAAGHHHRQVPHVNGVPAAAVTGRLTLTAVIPLPTHLPRTRQLHLSLNALLARLRSWHASGGCCVFDTIP